MARASARFSNDLRYRDGAHPNQRQLTPAYVLDPVRKALGGYIGLDPCTEPDNPCGAFQFYTPPQNGLTMPWWVAHTIYVNPPYSRAREPWVDRCISEADMGRRIILLMPAATDTRVFQKAMLSAAEVVFIRGRVKFGILRPNRRQQAASHPSALIGWNVSLEACEHLGMRTTSITRARDI
jgi:phage N-6-adenine-methyltransferase